MMSWEKDPIFARRPTTCLADEMPWPEYRLDIINPVGKKLWDNAMETYEQRKVDYLNLCEATNTLPKKLDIRLPLPWELD